jgi:hypothetical protein
MALEVPQEFPDPDQVYPGDILGTDNDAQLVADELGS